MRVDETARSLASGQVVICLTNGNTCFVRWLAVRFSLLSSAFRIKLAQETARILTLRVQGSSQSEQAQDYEIVEHRFWYLNRDE
jgi:hypothetical protein